MVSLDKAVIAKYKHGKKNFEVLVDPEKADLIRSGAEGGDRRRFSGRRDI